MKTRKRIFNLILITIVLVVASLIVRYIRNPYYIIVGNECFNTTCTSLDTAIVNNKWYNSINNLKYFHNLESLTISCYIDDVDFNAISSLENLKHIIISGAKVRDSSFTQKLSNIESINYLDGEVDMEHFENNNLNRIGLYNCKIENIQMLSKCKNLKDLTIYQGKYKGLQRVKNEYILKDSSVFSDFSSVTRLNLQDIKIENITGFQEMKSLKELTVSSGCVKEGLIDEIRKKGVNVKIN